MINLKQQKTSSSSQSGFTIIESLVALLVAAILLAAIAPVIVLSVATRVQARRIELATEAAKTYIDGLRSETILPAPPITKRNVGETTDPPPPDAPSGTLTCPTIGNGLCSISPTSSTFQLYCVGCTSDNSQGLIIQAFGYNLDSTNAEHGYKLGLRVYRRDAFKTGITLKASKDSIKQQQTFTGGTGLTSIQAPLVEMTTEISKNSTTFDNFCNRLKNTGNTKSNTTCG